MLAMTGRQRLKRRSRKLCANLSWRAFGGPPRSTTGKGLEQGTPSLQHATNAYRQLLKEGHVLEAQALRMVACGGVANCDRYQETICPMCGRFPATTRHRCHSRSSLKELVKDEEGYLGKTKWIDGKLDGPMGGLQCWWARPLMPAEWLDP